ncbi:MAG: BrnT family toxin [Treponemataceae bacterium]|nr:BrnT family toxin [Treponemataceae bacterium]
MATVVSDDGKFEWDSDKDEANFRKHGFHFAEILEVFDDPYFLVRYDAAHSLQEEWYTGLGCIRGVLVIVTTFTERERTRIVSARRADKGDKEVYDGYVEKINA